MEYVSLLPPELKKKRQEERIQGLVIRVVIVLFIIVMAVYAFLLVSSIITRNNIASLRAEREMVEMQVNALQPYADLYAQMNAAEERLQQALQNNPRWSDLLQEVGLALPPGIWLSDMDISHGGDGGALSIRGWGFSHDNIAEMLVRLQAMENVENVRISAATETTFEGQDAVQFAVDAVIINVTAAEGEEQEEEVN